MDDTGFRRGQALLNKHLTGRQTRTFHLGRREWELLDGVFSPTYTPVTELFSSWLPYPNGGTFLEIGSGAGVTAVHAALAGCEVTAVDISATAVENTRRNVVRHGVENRVRVLRSDLFSALGPDERFDLIYWNSNFAEAPSDFVNETELHHAFFDPSYDTHRAFVTEAPARLHPAGALMLGFSDIGNRRLLERFCAEVGRVPVVYRAQERQVDPETALRFELLDLRPVEGAGT